MASGIQEFLHWPQCLNHLSLHLTISTKLVGLRCYTLTGCAAKTDGACSLGDVQSWLQHSLTNNCNMFSRSGLIRSERDHAEDPSYHAWIARFHVDVDKLTDCLRVDCMSSAHAQGDHEALSWGLLLWPKCGSKDSSLEWINSPFSPLSYGSSTATLTPHILTDTET